MWHQETLRKGFASALEWYSYLNDRMGLHYDILVASARAELRALDGHQSFEEPMPEKGNQSPELANESLEGGRKRAATPDIPCNPFSAPMDRDRPSEYLRERCPACFGNLSHDPSSK
jgi:hypothetical protein